MGMGMHAARATVDPHVAPDSCATSQLLVLLYNVQYATELLYIR